MSLHSWQVQPKTKKTVIERAEGVFLYDSDGKRYYDMVSQSTSVNIGHANKKVIQAIKDQADKLIAIGPAFACEVRSALGKRILDISSDNMGKVFLTLAGADANENAIKSACNLLSLVIEAIKLFIISNWPLLTLTL